MTRTTSAAGRAAITQREGCRLTAYLDSVGVATIGVGHAATAPTPPAVRMGMTITAAEADEILGRDLAVFERAVNAAAPRGVSQNQFDAMVSLAFNIGVGAFSRSTVARKAALGDEQGAADAFLMWDKAGGEVVPGLAKRRQAERAQFLTPDSTPVLDAIKSAIARDAAALPPAPARASAPPPAPPYSPPAMVQHPATASTPLTFWQRIAAAFARKAA